MTEDEITQRALTAIRRFDNLRISGPGWSGNSREGFAFNPESGLAGFAGGGPPPPPTVSGACCYEDGTCAVVTQAICEDGGGTYQGDNTDCDPNPCPQPPPTGACCVGTSCTIETEDDCTNMGGVYQGDGTDCDPNPCEMPECLCGFDAFDGSGRRFLRYHRDIAGSWDIDETCGEDFTFTASATVSGSWEFHFEGCDEIEDLRTAMSHREETLNGVPGTECNHDDSVDCFCNTILVTEPCTSPFGYCFFISCNDFTEDIVTTATVRTTTWDLSSDCTEFGCHCTRTGTYVVTETLSNECTPI